MAGSLPRSGRLSLSRVARPTLRGGGEDRLPTVTGFHLRAAVTAGPDAGATSHLYFTLKRLAALRHGYLNRLAALAGLYPAPAHRTRAITGDFRTRGQPGAVSFLPRRDTKVRRCGAVLPRASAYSCLRVCCARPTSRTVAASRSPHFGGLRTRSSDIIANTRRRLVGATTRGR